LAATQKLPQPSPAILDRLLNLWLRDEHQFAATCAAFTLFRYANPARNVWRPMLTEAQLQRLRQVKGEALTPGEQYALLASYMVALHEASVWPGAELAERLGAAAEQRYSDERAINAMLRPAEAKYLKRKS
jgi:hypothetical protein